MTDTPPTKSLVAGILDIASGLTALIGGAFMGGIGIIGTGVLIAVPDDIPPIQWIPLAVFGPIALLILIAGAIAVIGGIKAIRRSSWPWTIAGAIASLLCCIPLGIIALVFTVMAEGEFKPRHAVQPNVKTSG